MAEELVGAVTVATTMAEAMEATENASPATKAMVRRPGEAVEEATAAIAHTLQRRKKKGNTKERKKKEIGSRRRSKLRRMIPPDKATASSPSEDREKGGGLSV